MSRFSKALSSPVLGVSAFAAAGTSEEFVHPLLQLLPRHVGGLRNLRRRMPPSGVKGGAAPEGESGASHMALEKTVGSGWGVERGLGGERQTCIGQRAWGMRRIGLGISIGHGECGIWPSTPREVAVRDGRGEGLLHEGDTRVCRGTVHRLREAGDAEARGHNASFAEVTHSGHFQALRLWNRTKG